jgi:hypothetical protein
VGLGGLLILIFCRWDLFEGVWVGGCYSIGFDVLIPKFQGGSMSGCGVIDMFIWRGMVGVQVELHDVGSFLW